MAIAVTLMPVAVLARALFADMSNVVVGDAGDPVFVFAVLRATWVTLLRAPWAIADLPIYYPNVRTLFMSDLLVIPSVAFGVLRAIVGNEIVAYNVVVILCLVANAVSMVWLMRRWTGSSQAAVASGVAFALSPILMAQIGHLPLQMAWCLPLAVLAADHMADRGTPRSAVALAGVIAVQFVTATYLAFGCAIAAGWCIGVRVLMARYRRHRLTLASLVVLAGLLGITVGPVALQYYAVSQTQGVARTVAENIVYSAEPASFLLGERSPWVPPPRTEAGMMKEAHEKRLWPGWVVVVLVPAAAWAWSWRRRLFDPLDGVHLATGAVMAVAGLVAALGPYLVVDGVDTGIPLPYLLALKGIPGFAAMRVPARFGILMAFGLAVIAGIAVARLPRLLGTATGQTVWGAVLTGLVAAVSLARPPLPVARIDAIIGSPMASVLATRLPGAVLWYPVHAATADPGPEIARMAVNRGMTPMANGYSGMFPLSVFQLRQLMERSTPAVARSVLVSLGVHHVIFDRATTPPAMTEGWSRLGGGLVTVRFDAPETLVLDLAVTPQPNGSVSLRIDETRLVAAAPVSIPVRVTNQSDATWVSAATTHPHPVEVSWQRAGERTFATDTVRVILPMYLERGTSTLVTVPLTPPSMPGPYTLSVSSILGVVRKTVTVDVGRANP